MILYLAVTADKYELPLMVTDNIQELAEKYKTTGNNIRSSISKGINGKCSGRKFVKVEVEEC